jgi:hypothetical protein
MSRRAFLSSGAAAGIASVALGGAGAASASADATPANDVDAIVLQIAAAAAVFPFVIETGEAEPASARLTGQRVTQAWARCSAERAAQAERAARRLIDLRLGGVDTDELLLRLSVLAAQSGPSDLGDLNALVGVAGATLVDAVDPDGEIGPTIWLGTLSNMHDNGDRPVVEAAP